MRCCLLARASQTRQANFLLCNSWLSVPLLSIRGIENCIRPLSQPAGLVSQFNWGDQKNFTTASSAVSPPHVPPPHVPLVLFMFSSQLLAAFAAAPVTLGRPLTIPGSTPSLPFHGPRCRKRRKCHITATLKPRPSTPQGQTSASPTPVRPAASDVDPPEPVPVPVPAPAAPPFSSLALLNVVAVIWGTQHAVIKLAVEGGISPAALSAARFAIAATAATPLLPRGPGAAVAVRAALRPGLELGAWMTAGYALQAVGLLTTTASRSCFLLYLNVKLVPVFAALLYGRKVPVATWASAAVAFTGTALLTWDGSPPNVGDLWSIAAAAASAMFILRMEAAAADDNVQPAALNAISLITVAAASGCWYLCSWLNGNEAGGVALPLTLEAWAPLLYLGLVTTALSNWLQAKGQRDVAAEQAAIIFSMDPVYGLACSYLLLGERCGPQGWVGVALVGAAALWSNLQAGGAQSSTVKDDL